MSEIADIEQCYQNLIKDLENLEQHLSSQLSSDASDGPDGESDDICAKTSSSYVKSVNAVYSYMVDELFEL